MIEMNGMSFIGFENEEEIKELFPEMLYELEMSGYSMAGFSGEKEKEDREF